MDLTVPDGLYLLKHFQLYRRSPRPGVTVYGTSKMCSRQMRALFISPVTPTGATVTTTQHGASSLRYDRMRRQLQCPTTPRMGRLPTIRPPDTPTPLIRHRVAPYPLYERLRHPFVRLGPSFTRIRRPEGPQYAVLMVRGHVLHLRRTNLPLRLAPQTLVSRQRGRPPAEPPHTLVAP